MRTTDDRHGNRRWWAGALLAIAAAGAFASASAAQQSGLGAATECAASQIGVGYEVGLGTAVPGYAVTGIRVTDFPARCAGRAVAISVHDATGAVLGTATGVLARGTVLAMPAGASVPASAAERLTISAA